MSMESSRAKEVLARFQRRHPEAARLAELVCLATRIESGLLREARLRLAPGLDAGSEADLWFSPLVESWSTRAFVLKPEFAALLQAELIKDRARARRAWELIQRLHGDTVPIVALEERVTWLALSQGEQALPRIERELSTVLRTMMHDEHQSMGVARWALRALPRLPPLVRNTSLGRLLAFGATARLGLRSLLEGRDSPPLPEGALWVLPRENASTRQEVRLIRTPEGLTAAELTGSTEGSVLAVPLTQPLLLEVEWEQEGHEQHRLFSPQPGNTLPLPPAVTILRLRTVLGEEFELSPAPMKQEEQMWHPPHPDVWDSCAWIPHQGSSATAYFLEPSVLVTAASVVEKLSPGDSVDVFWNAKQLRTTLLAADGAQGFALLELQGEPPPVKVFHHRTFGWTDDDYIHFHEHPDDPGRNYWIAYGLLFGKRVWGDGTYNFNPRPGERLFIANRTLMVLKAVAPLPLPVGSLILEDLMSGFDEGFIIGHLIEFRGHEAIVCPVDNAVRALDALREARSALHQSTPQEAESPELEDGHSLRREELLRLIRESRSEIESEVEAQLPELLANMEVGSQELPSDDHMGTISLVGGLQRLSLDESTLEPDGSDAALIEAIIEVEDVSLNVYMSKADYYGMSDEEDALFPATNLDWNDHVVEVEPTVSLRFTASLQIQTETPDDDVERIIGVHVSNVDDLEVLELIGHVREPPANRARSPWSHAVSQGGYTLAATVQPTEKPGSYRVDLEFRPSDARKRPMSTVLFRLGEIPKPRSHRVEPVGGAAKLAVETPGAFKLSAKMGEVRLSMNLAEVAGVPEEFRTRGPVDTVALAMKLLEGPKPKRRSRSKPRVKQR